MKNRKWQRILSWILTMTMLLGTFESNILAVNAMDDEAVEADAEIDEADVVEADGDVEIPEDEDASATYNAPSGVSITGTLAAATINTSGELSLGVDYGKVMNPQAKFTATVKGDNTNTVTWKLFDAHWKETTWAAGLTGTIANNEYTLSGTPTEIVSGKVYTLSAVSSNGTASANATVTLTVKKAASADLQKAVTGTWAASYKMGYTVDGTAAATSTNVVPKTITFTNATGADLSGLYVTLDETGAKSFDLVGGGTDVSLKANETLTLTVAPKAGLLAEGTNNTTTKDYSATLTVSGDCLDGTQTETFAFKVANNIEVSVTKAGAAFTGNEISVSAGNAIETVVYTATGGAGKLQWEESSLLDGTQSKLPAGIIGTISDSGETLTISGKIGVVDGVIGSKSFTPVVKDEKNNSYQLNAQTIKVDPADITVKVQGQDEDTYTNALNTGYRQADTAITVTVKNNSQSPVVISANFADGDKEKFSFDTNETQTIDPNAEAEFKIVADTGLTESKYVDISISGNAAEGNAIAEKVITYRLVIADELTITNPVSDNTALPSATVGTAYAGYQFAARAIKNDTTAKTWTVSDNFVGTLPEGYTQIGKAELKSQYGLELSADGKLTGTPKKVGKLAFTVSVNQSGSVSFNSVNISINKAQVAISAKDAAGNELSGDAANVSQNGVALSLGTVATNMKDSVSASVATKIVADADFTPALTAEIVTGTTQKWDDAQKKYVGSAANIFSVVYKSGATSISSNKTEEDMFWVEADKTAIGALNPSTVGSYRALVKINTNDNLEPKTFWVTLDVTNSPAYYGFYDKNSSVNADNNPAKYRTIEAIVNTDIVSVNLVAVSKNATTPIDVTWTWEPASATESIPEGLSLSTAGKITGTPTDAGTYVVSVNMTDSNNVKETVNITITVAGTGDITVLSGNTVVSGNTNTGVVDQYFPGVVKGAAAGGARSFVIKNESTTDLTNISIAIQDAEGYTGSAAHFELSKSSIASLAKNTSEVINITPKDTSKSGIYKAKVKVSSKTTPDRVFYVWFGVVDELKINDIPAADLAWTVGKEAKVTVSACTVSYNATAGGVVSQNVTDIKWTIKTISANGTELAWTENSGNATICDKYNGVKGVVPYQFIPEVAGTRYVSINAVIPEKENGLIAEQSVNLKLTIEVAKSASVNVTKATGAAGGYATGKSVSTNGFITSYTFAPKAVGYAASKETATFTVENASKAELNISANATSTNFVVTNGAAANIAANNGTNNGTKTYTVAPKDGLAAGTYTAQLIISGENIESQVVELSFTVEAANPSISVSDNDGKSIADGIVLKATKKGVAPTNTTISVNNTGNVDITITEVREVKNASGTNYAVGEDNLKKLAEITKPDGTAKPGEYKNFTIKPVNSDTISENETYVKVTYSAAGATQTPVVFKVNYTIYNNAVSVNFTPSENLVKLNDASVSENYTTTYSKAIILTNGEAGVAGNTTDVLHNLKVTIAAVNSTPAESIELTGAKYKLNDAEVVGVKELAKGDSFSINVAAANGLPYGIYNAEVTFEADNLAQVKKTVSFNVSEMAPDYVVDITTEGTEDVYKSNIERLTKTLAALHTQDSANYAVNSGKYTINADKYGEADVEVDLSDASKAVIKKLDTSTVSAASVTISQNGSNPASPSFNQITFNLFDIVSFNAMGGKFVENGKDTISINVANGGKIAEFPSVSKNGASLKAWLDKDNNEVTTATTISKDTNVYASWSNHTYPASASGNTASINWTWNGSASDNFAGTYVTIYCIDADCPDRAASAVKINATVTKSGKDASCETGAANVFTAKAVVDKDHVYTDAKTVTTGEGLGHVWKFDETTVVWAADYSSATISKNCVAKYHDDERDGDKQVGVTTTNISFNGVSANCTTSGNGVYTATWTKAEDPAISENIVVSIKMDEIPAFGHKWVVKSVESDGSFETAPTKATLNIVCERDAEHKESVSASKIELVSSNDTQKTYKYSGEATDGQAVEGEETFYSHKEHDYTVSFNWSNVSTNKADTVVTAEATCKNGGEKIALEVTLTDKTIGSKIEYTASATDPNGKVWTSKKNIDTKTGEEKDGPAGTPTVEGGDIVIIGVEETYAFTGSKIKPAITVMDGDIVLAQSTDYTVSYKGKNKVNEINTVEVKGKGNYAGKSATAKFTIVDSRADIDPEELAGAIKKVSVSEKNFTYNGKAQYPATVTVELKDKTKIVYTVDEDGSFDTDSDKKVGLSFSNNINKGTATVAAMGSDGKVKKASYKIAAADISTATFVVDEATWAVKPEAAKVTATFGDDEMELVAGQDFKVTYTAKAAGDAAGSAKISGKGNFKGKLSAPVSYKVNALELEEKNIIVSAVAGKKISNVKVQVVDNAGNALGKKLYTVAFFNGETELGKKDVVPEDLTVVVKASGNATTDEDGISVTVKPAKDIAKVKGAFKVDKNFSKTYTGEAIELDAEDFVAGKIDPKGLEYGTDFEVVSYKNNVKKGSMIVTVEGKGEYSGTKTFKVKIKAKPIDKAVNED